MGFSELWQISSKQLKKRFAELNEYDNERNCKFSNTLKHTEGNTGYDECF